MEYCEDFLYKNKIEILNSLMPNIFSYEFQKLAILIQLVGGRFEKGRIKPINCLIIGSPATAKTQMCLELERLGFSSGSIIGDQFDSESISSILGNEDKIYLFDEIDKKFQRKGSKETIKLKKNRLFFIDILKNKKVDDNLVKSSVLSIANLGNYNFGKNVLYYEILSILEKNISKEIIFSHDIIFYNTDQPDKINDSKIAEGILNLRANLDNNEKIMNSQELKDYINYVRKNIHPYIPAEIGQFILTKVEELRRNLKGERKEIFEKLGLFNRQIVVIENISIALAKLNLREEVSKADVLNAFYYFKDIIKTFISETIEEKKPITPKILTRDINYLFEIILDLSFENNIIEFSEDNIIEFRTFYKIQSDLGFLIEKLVFEKKIVQLENGKYRRADW